MSSSLPLLEPVTCKASSVGTKRRTPENEKSNDPNINATLKRSRRRLTPPNSGKKDDEWTPSVKEETEAPVTNKSKRKSHRRKQNKDTGKSKNEVWTPKTSVIDGIFGLSHESACDRLVSEDTSNETYFLRHYRAEMREKLFYDDLFKSRCEKQRMKEDSSEKTTESQSDECEDHLNPHNYKLTDFTGPSEIPDRVKKVPRFNYNISFVEIQKRVDLYKKSLLLKKGEQLSEEEQKTLDSDWWTMPPRLIKRTDVGTVSRNTFHQIENKPQARMKMLALLKKARKSKKRGSGPVDIRKLLRSVQS